MTELAELRKTWVIYFIDTDPDTGFVSQMIPVAYTEKETNAKFIMYCFAGEDFEPNREYKYTHL